MAAERVIWDAQFNPRVTFYWLLSGAIALTFTCVGIVLLPLWFIIGGILTQRYLATYRCTLTDRSLKVNKGWLVKVEKTVPLDRITDVTLVQGPIMRLLDIESLSVETAGQSTEGALVRLAGILEGRKFRDTVLRQRELVVGSEEDRQQRAIAAPTSAPTAAGQSNVEVLRAIYDALRRIEKLLEK